MHALNFDELKEFLEKHRDKNTLITFHSIGDRDAVGSALAIATLFKHPTLVTPDYITNNARRMLEQTGGAEKIGHGFPKEVAADPEHWFVLVVDTNEIDTLGPLSEDVRKFSGEVLFVDHHLPEDDGEHYLFTDESFNSTSSIVYKLLKLMRVWVSKETAIYLLNGIISDSADFQNATAETFAQIGELLGIADTTYSGIMEYFHEAVPAANRYTLIRDLFNASTEMIGKYVLVYGEVQMHANIVADKAIKVGADASVFWGVTESEATISARLKSPLDTELKIHLGKIMQELRTTLGGSGGGHSCAAGAYGPKKDMIGESVAIVLERIRRGLSGNAMEAVK